SDGNRNFSSVAQVFRGFRRTASPTPDRTQEDRCRHDQAFAQEDPGEKIMNSILDAFVNGSIVSTVVVLAVSIILGSIPRAFLNAATRYWIWWSALLASAVIVVLCLPSSRDKTFETSVQVLMTPTEGASHAQALQIQQALDPLAYRSSTASRRLFPIR